MRKQISFFAIMLCALFLVSGLSYAQDSQPISENTIKATCAQQVFADALIADAASVNEESPEVDIQAWIYKNFKTTHVDCGEKIITLHYE